MSDLKKLQEMVDELNNTNSNNDKKEILAKYPCNKRLLKYVYNPYWKYGVTSKNCKKRTDLCKSVTNNIYELLDMLEKRMITGHDAIGAVNGFIENNSEFADLIYLIIDKNLKTRTDSKLINKVYPNLIPTFEVALAVKYDEKTGKNVSFDGKSWYMSRKLDGLRCITIVDNVGEVKTFSRAGNEFTTLQKVKDEIKKLGLTNIVFDGEICIIDENGNEDFTKAVSQVKKKDFTLENPMYKIFDMLTLEDFQRRTSEEILSTRLEKLNATIPLDAKYLNVVEQIPLTEESFATMQKVVADEGWEGLMLRANIQYEGKRSKNLLKVKKFFDDEYIVKDVEMGIKPLLIDGKMVDTELMASVKIEHKGQVVSVGSGFSDSERLEYFKNPKKIIGKTITVQYFEESQDKTGKLSLRFPTVKFIYENGRDV